MKIQELPNLERPYEKTLKHGTEVLSNAELLAIIIKSGTKGKNSVQIAQNLLTNNEYKKEGFSFLHNLSIEELTSYEGIGEVKAIQLKALSEIIKRSQLPTMENSVKIKNTYDIANIMIPKLKHQTTEELHIALIDIKCNLKRIYQASLGQANNIFFNQTIVFKEAIKTDTPRIIIIHNHPSGDPTPSEADIEFTKKIIKLGDDLGIKVLDHIIIGDNTYKSVFSYID